MQRKKEEGKKEAIKGKNKCMVVECGVKQTDLVERETQREINTVEEIKGEKGSKIWLRVCEREGEK